MPRTTRTETPSFIKLAAFTHGNPRTDPFPCTLAEYVALQDAMLNRVLPAGVPAPLGGHVWLRVEHMEAHLEHWMRRALFAPKKHRKGVDRTQIVQVYEIDGLDNKIED